MRLPAIHNPFLKFAIGTALGIAVALLLAFNILLVWVATGPRSLDGLSPYIEATFKSATENYSVKIEHTWLIWDGWQHPVDIRLRNVSIYTKEGQRFSSFPEISLGIDIWELPLGRILPTSLSITHPVIRLYQGDDRSISFGFQQAEEEATPAAMPSVPFAAVVAPLLTPDGSSLRKLHYISISNADVLVGNRAGVFCKASGVNILFRRNWLGRVQAFIGGRISYDKYQSMVNARFSFEQDQPAMQGEIQVSQLMPGTLAALFSDNPILSALKLPVSGSGKVSLDRNGTLTGASFTVDGSEGVISTNKLDGEIPVKTLHVEGALSNNAKTIDITALSADLGGMLATGKGSVSLGNDDTAITADVDVKNVPASKVHLLWPPGVSPMSRDWVTSNITDGTVQDASAHVAIPMGDLKKPVLPKQDINAMIILEGAKIRYLPDHPPVSGVKGVIHVDAASLTADIASGNYMQDTHLSKGTLAIDDLNADNPYIKVAFDADASAKDIVRFLGLPRLKHAARLNLNEATAEGTLKGHATVGFHFFAPRDAQGNATGDADVDYDVTAEASGLSQPGFLHKFDIENANGSFTVNNTSLEYKGSADVNGAHVTQGDIRYLFEPDKGFDTFIDATASAPVESLPRFGYPAFPFLTGTLGIRVNLKQGAADELYNVTFDLTDAGVTLRELDWKKPVHEAASLDLVAEKKSGAVTIPDFHLKGQDVDVAGSAELNPDLTGFKRITTGSMHAGKTRLSSLNYETIDGGFKLEAEGESADAAPWIESDNEPEDTFSFEHFPAVQLKLTVDHLVLGKDREVSGFKGALDCTTLRCENANMSGKTLDGKPFAFRILRNPKGERQLSLHAESAGAFLKAFDVFDGMQGGDLTIIGNYTDTASSSTLKGRVDITEHTIKNAPILARILSLASLTGFFDMLGGNGIDFVKLRIPFTLADDVLTIKDGKTHGAALGMTVDGTITFPKRTLNLQGTIVPSYTLNNVIGHVPLVGHLLTGGEGQGIFAARYSVAGSIRKPDVSVNPLSFLTPGFLRGLFDVFDHSDSSGKSDANPD